MDYRVATPGCGLNIFVVSSLATSTVHFAEVYLAVLLAIDEVGKQKAGSLTPSYREPALGSNSFSTRPANNAGTSGLGLMSSRKHMVRGRES